MQSVRTNLNIDFVATKNNGDIFTDTLEIAMPVGNVLVCDSEVTVEHDDSTLPLDVVPISEATELLLAGSIPDIEAYGTKVGGEGQRMDFGHREWLEKQVVRPTRQQDE